MSMLHWRGRRRRKIGEAYLLRDDFGHDVAAGSVNGTVAVPGPGTRTVTDTDSKLSIAGGKGILQSHTTPAAGDPGLWFPARTRAAGRVMVFKVTPTASKKLLVGFDNAQSGAIQHNAIHFLDDGKIDLFDAGSVALADIAAYTATDYWIAVALRAAGALFYIKGGAFTKWEYLGETTSENTATLYPGICEGGIAGNTIYCGPAQVPAYRWLPAPLASDGFGTVPTIEDTGDNGLDGTAVKVALGGATNKALFDGANSYIDIYSADLNTFFDGAEGTVIARTKVANSSFWTDGMFHQNIRIAVDGSNEMFLRKSTSDNLMEFKRDGGGVAKNVTVAGQSDVDYVTWGMTWSETDDKLIAYKNGGAQGSPTTGLGTWAGTLASDSCTIGANDTGSSQTFSGWIGDVILSNQVATPTQMSTIHTKLAAGTLVSSDLDDIFGAGNWAWWKLDEQYKTDGLGHAETDGYGAGGDARTWRTQAGFLDGSGKAGQCPAPGAELWDADAAVFTTGTYSWTAIGGNGIANVSNTLQITYVDDDRGAYIRFRDAHDLSSNLTVGVWYLFEVDAKINSGGAIIHVLDGVGTLYIDPFTNTDFETKTYVFRAQHEADGGMQFDNMGSGEIVTIDNLTIKPLVLAHLFSSLQLATQDVIIKADLTVTSKTQAGVVINLDDPDNPQNLTLITTDGIKVYIDKCVGGTWSNVSTTSIAYGAGYTLEVHKRGNSVDVWYNGAKVGSTNTISDAGIVSNKYHGRFSTYVDNRVENLTIRGRGINNEYIALDKFK